MPRVALFITYTMASPVVGGAFFRSLRLACELARRNWQPIIANCGPSLADPKVDAARKSVHFIPLDRESLGLTADSAAAQFRALRADIAIMGEYPFELMKIYYDAARRLDTPLVVLDQFYCNTHLPAALGADLVLLYALASFWNDELSLGPPYEIVPPFIEEVTPESDLPVPDRLREHPWISLVAYDDYVTHKGIELLAQLENTEPAIIGITPSPETFGALTRSAGIDAARVVCLPLQSDANVFGFFGSSAVTLVSNGFLQIMDALAMASPVIALERGSGVGMSGLNIDARFVPYVSFQENQEQQLGRIRRWLHSNPLGDRLKARLAGERHGVLFAANRIEETYRHWRAELPWRRAARRWLNAR